jgi:hypothetical protein
MKRSSLNISSLNIIAHGVSNVPASHSLQSLEEGHFLPAWGQWFACHYGWTCQIPRHNLLSAMRKALLLDEHFGHSTTGVSHSSLGRAQQRIIGFYQGRKQSEILAQHWRITVLKQWLIAAFVGVERAAWNASANNWVHRSFLPNILGTTTPILAFLDKVFECSTVGVIGAGGGPKQKQHKIPEADWCEQIEMAIRYGLLNNFICDSSWFNFGKLWFQLLLQQARHIEYQCNGGFQSISDPINNR